MGINVKDDCDRNAQRLARHQVQLAADHGAVGLIIPIRAKTGISTGTCSRKVVSSTQGVQRSSAVIMQCRRHRRAGMSAPGARRLPLIR